MNAEEFDRVVGKLCGSLHSLANEFPKDFTPRITIEVEAGGRVSFTIGYFTNRIYKQCQIREYVHGFKPILAHRALTECQEKIYKEENIKLVP